MIFWFLFLLSVSFPAFVVDWDVASVLAVPVISVVIISDVFSSVLFDSAVELLPVCPVGCVVVDSLKSTIAFIYGNSWVYKFYINSIITLWNDFIVFVFLRKREFPICHYTFAVIWNCELLWIIIIRYFNIIAVFFIVYTGNCILTIRTWLPIFSCVFGKSWQTAW